MRTDNGCLQHLDALSGKAPLNAEAAAHLKTCPACRRAADTIGALRSEKTAWPTLDLSGLRRRVVERVRLEPRPQSGRDVSQTGIEPVVPWWEALLSVRALGLAAALAVLMLAVVFWSTRVSPVSRTVQTTGGQEFRLTRADGTVETRPLHDLFSIATETVELALPDGSQLTLTGPAKAQAFSRGFSIERGTVRARVKPGQTTFTGRTPHGEITVLGTIFVCRVTEQETLVRVEEGKVRIVSTHGPERVLVAGQTAAMLYSAHAGTPGEIRENPAVESDPSQ